MYEVTKDICEVKAYSNGNLLNDFHPKSIVIERSYDVPSCTVAFDDETLRGRFLTKDSISIWVSINKYSTIHQFWGFINNETVSENLVWTMTGVLGAATNKFITIDDKFNYDGWEVSSAIMDALTKVPLLSGIPLRPQITVPEKIIKEFRAEDGINIGELVSQLKEMAIDNERASDILNYTLYEYGAVIFFRKVVDPLAVITPAVKLTYGKDLIGFQDNTEPQKLVNTQKVYGAEGVYGEFTYNHRVTYDGIIEGEPIQDDNILNNAEAFEIARATVLSSVYRDRKVTAHSLELLNAIPGITTVELTEMPYGLSGKYIVDSVRISIDASGGIDISSELRRRSSLSRSYNISDALRNVLGPSTSRPN